jgi:hypothetical protein
MGAAGVAAGVAGGALAMRALGGAVAGGWAAGGAQVAAARSAAGAIPPAGGAPPAGGSSPSPGGGGGGGGGPGPGDFARAPVSSTVQTLRTAGARVSGGGPSGEAEPPPPPPPSETIARAESRRGGVGDLPRGATAASQHEQGGPGMTATPSRDPSDPEA